MPLHMFAVSDWVPDEKDGDYTTISGKRSIAHGEVSGPADVQISASWFVSYAQ